MDRHTYGFEDKVVPIVREHKVGIVAMKAFGGLCGGNYPDPKCPPMLDLKHLDLAVRYTLSVPGVATVNIGVHNVEQLRKNVAMVKCFQPLSSEEQARCLALEKNWPPSGARTWDPWPRAIGSDFLSSTESSVGKAASFAKRPAKIGKAGSFAHAGLGRRSSKEKTGPVFSLTFARWDSCAK